MSRNAVTSIALVALVVIALVVYLTASAPEPQGAAGTAEAAEALAIAERAAATSPRATLLEAGMRPAEPATRPAPVEPDPPYTPEGLGPLETD